MAEARDRGQTVLLSSPILSEVEAICDRVAILRAGRLVEVGVLADMRHLQALHVEAELGGPVPDLSSRWLRDTSPLLHITPAPAADPNWAAALWLVALGLLAGAAGAAGVAAFARRDLQAA